MQLSALLNHKNLRRVRHFKLNFTLPGTLLQHEKWTKVIKADENNCRGWEPGKISITPTDGLSDSRRAGPTMWNSDSPAGIVSIEWRKSRTEASTAITTAKDYVPIRQGPGHRNEKNVLGSMQQESDRTIRAWKRRWKKEGSLLYFLETKSSAG